MHAFMIAGPFLKSSLAHHKHPQQTTEQPQECHVAVPHATAIGRPSPLQISRSTAAWHLRHIRNSLRECLDSADWPADRRRPPRIAAAGPPGRPQATFQVFLRQAACSRCVPSQWCPAHEMPTATATGWCAKGEWRANKIRRISLGGVVKRVCSRSSLPGAGRWPNTTPFSWHSGSPPRATA